MMQGVNNQKTVRKKPSGISKLWQYRWLYLMALPGVVFFVIFAYIPMGGVVVAFQNYQPFLGIANSPWVGFAHFQRFFTEDTFGLLFGNTLALFGFGLLVFPLPIILSLMINEVGSKLYKSAVQSIIYIPHFISWVIAVSMFFVFLATDRGLVNEVIVFFGGERISFLTDPAWARPLWIIQGVWKSLGWSTIIYLAAIASVDLSLFEAASLDGAGRFRQIWHVTLPAIRPTVIILLILNIGNALDNNVEHLLLLINSINRHMLDVFDTYVFRVGLTLGQFSFSTAVGLFKGVVGLILVVGANRLARKIGEEGIF